MNLSLKNLFLLSCIVVAHTACVRGADDEITKVLQEAETTLRDTAPAVAQVPGVLAAAARQEAERYKADVTDPLIWQNTLRGKLEVPYLNVEFGLYNKDFINLAEQVSVLATDYKMYRYIQDQHVEHMYKLLTKKTHQMLKWLTDTVIENPGLTQNNRAAISTTVLKNTLEAYLTDIDMELSYQSHGETYLRLAGLLAVQEGMKSFRRSTLVYDWKNPEMYKRYERDGDGQLQQIKEFPLGLSTSTGIVQNWFRHPIKSALWWWFLWRHLPKAYSGMQRTRDYDIGLKVFEDAEVMGAKFLIQNMFPFIPDICFTKPFRLVFNYAILIFILKSVYQAYTNMWVNYMFDNKMELRCLLTQYQELKTEALENPTEEIVEQLEDLEAQLLTFVQNGHSFNRFFSRDAYDIWTNSRKYTAGLSFSVIAFCYTYYRIIKFAITVLKPNQDARFEARRMAHLYY